MNEVSLLQNIVSDSQPSLQTDIQQHPGEAPSQKTPAIPGISWRLRGQGHHYLQSEAFTCFVTLPP